MSAAQMCANLVSVRLSRRAAVAGLLAAVALSVNAADKSAGDYPNRPLRVLVGQVPGGGVDLLARALAQKLTETLGQHVVVDNRGGAAGSIAAGLAAKATPDGYTALVVSATYSINPSLYKKLPFDPRKDLQPITVIGASPFILLANPSAVPAKNVKELIAAAKAKPRHFNFGSGGIGSTGHLSAELFASLAGIQLTHVPYKGTGPAMIDLLSGQVHLLFNSMIQGMPYAKSGKLTAIAITSAKRSPVMPDLPSIAESGVPAYDFSTWYGVLMPSGVPKPVVAKFHAEVVKALNQADFRERLSKSGIEPGGNTPEEFTTYLASEMAKWAKVVKSIGMKVE